MGGEFNTVRRQKKQNKTETLCGKLFWLHHQNQKRLNGYVPVVT